MPCSSDYLRSTNFEQACQNTARLIFYVNKKLGVFTPAWIKECSENSYGAPKGGAGGDKRLVPYLCALLKSLNNETLEKIAYNAKDKDSRALADWKEEHDRADLKRLEEEFRVKRDKRIKKKALQKLSQKEKEVLGL